MTASVTPSGFFVLRAPLLPLEELDRLRADPSYWRTLAERPEVIEALHLATPGLVRRLAGRTGDDARVAAAVTAYLVRMCARATPFGLFASCAVGVMGEETALVVDGPEGTARHSRPDTEVLASLVARLLADPATRPEMVVEPNSSRYQAAGAMRLIESRVHDGRRSHHLVVVEDDAPLRCAVEAASGGRAVGRVTVAVQARTGATDAEAREYVDALVEAQVLTPVAEPAVTGLEPLPQVLSALTGSGLEATKQQLIEGLGLLSPIVVLLVGAHLVLTGQLSLGTMLALAALSGAFLEPLATLVETALQVQLLGSYLDRIDDVLNTPTETAGRDLLPAPVLTGAVRAEGLTFCYTAGGPPAVEGADIDVRPGQVLAIVGRSGSGKSTLGRLLLGLYPPTSGRVLLDGIDLATLQPRSVRSQIGVVTQDPYIFGLSIRDNVALGDPGLPLERLESAAALACIAGDIHAMPLGWQTPLVDAGASLSGGQRQRLALARALATRPRILLLDEATSHLDTVTEAQVYANIAAIGCTVIVIAHRLATVIDADRIVVLDAGRVAEAGCHRELLAAGAHYAQLVAAQLVGEAPSGDHR